MATAYRLYVGVVTALALCKCSLAEWNATEEPTNHTSSPCHHHGNRYNCTVTTTATPKETDQMTGHFSKCPEELTFYCVHGDCRYVMEQSTPSCRCHQGYVGSRCEYIDLDWLKGDRKQIFIICVVTGLVFLILIIVFICLCSNRRLGPCRSRGRRGREEVSNGTEKLNMMDSTGTTLEAHTPDPTEPLHTHAV